MRYTLIFIGVLCCLQAAKAQENASIKGIISDEKGEPTLGLTVLLDGTNFGAITDIKGQFSIDGLNPGTYTITISGLGFKAIKASISLKENSTLQFDKTIEEDTQQLEEVVVYGKSEATQIREQA